MANTKDLFHRKLRWEKHEIGEAGQRKNHSANLVGGRVYLCCGYAFKTRRNLNDVSVIEETKQKNRRNKKGFGVYEVRLSDSLRPQTRNGHTTNLVKDQLFIFGGWSGGRVLSDVWVFDLVLHSWSELETSGKRHPMLNMHLSEYIEWMNCILCFGGGDGQIFENSVTCLFLGNREWKKLQPKGTPPSPVANSGGCLVDSTYYVFGGWNRIGKYNDLHLLHLPKDFRKPFWSTLLLNEKPRKRVGMGMANFHGRISVFGGSGSTYFDDMQFYDIQEKRWYRSFHTGTPKMSPVDEVELEVAGSWPPRRIGHTVTTLPSGGLLVFGGNARTTDHSSDGFHVLRLSKTLT